MENNNVNNTITYDCKFEQVTPDLDFETYNEILGKERVEKAYDEDGINHLFKGKYYPHPPMKIETLKKMLSNLEDEGCNYVSVDYHCDHIEYELFGLDVHTSTEEEIKENEDKERTKMLERTTELRKAAKQYLEEVEKIETNLPNRQRAMLWWNELSDIKKSKHCYLFSNGSNRKWQTLTGSEIEKIWNSNKK